MLRVAEDEIHKKSIAIIIFKEEVSEPPEVGDGIDRLTIGQRSTTDALDPRGYKAISARSWEHHNSRIKWLTP